MCAHCRWCFLRRRATGVAIAAESTLAGLAVAAFLKKQGHQVRIFERFEKPRPLGAGLLLQPTGLACLAKLGLDDRALHYGARINHLYGKTADERIIFDLSYSSHES